jgi:Ca2+/H+ antiporter
LDNGRSKACEAVTLTTCVLAVGSWLVGEHANAVAAVLGAVIGSFLCGEEVAKTWDSRCSTCARS